MVNQRVGIKIVISWSHLPELPVLSKLILYFCFVQKWYKIYKRNIYGVMGTLVFHILLFSAFLLADVDIKGNVKEEAIVIEFPDIIPEPELTEEGVQQDEGKDLPGPDQLNRSNLASSQTATENTTTSADEFFDSEYMREIEAARQLRSSVDNNLSKETVDLSEIDMPVETTEGMDRDSIKNVIYAGESNIKYYLGDRYHVRLPVPVYLAQGGGTVIVDIKVDRSGKVIQANARENKSIRDQQIFLYAQEAASRTLFNADSSAPEPQSGTIEYTFVAQWKLHVKLF